MATHTDGGAGEGLRKFSIGRENGQNAKDGKPYFFEYLKELPPAQSQKGRKFETRRNGAGEARHYELFQAVSGQIRDLKIETKTIEGKAADWLILTMHDDGETYKIEVSKTDHRYAQDVMKRLLDDRFDPSTSLRLSPYDIKDKQTGRNNIGVAMISGMDSRLEAKRESPHLAQMVGPREFEGRDGKEYDWRPVSAWLWAQMLLKVLPKIHGSAIIPNRPAPKPEQPSTDNFPTAEPPAFPADNDDLPF